jgi:hypothetical protein
MAAAFPTINDGDWVHCAITGGQHGLRLYINGVIHPTGMNANWVAKTRGAQLKIGRAGSYGLMDSGLSHFRIDRRAWTAEEVVDHYDTYFADPGRGAVEPTFGKEMVIDEMEWELRPGGGNNQWLGKVILRELGVEEDFAPMQRQEDM